MIKLLEKYSDYIQKDDATYAEGTFVDFARTVKSCIKSEQMKGNLHGWTVEHYTVPEIDRTTKEIRTDSFALVFKRNGKNVFYIETLLKPDYYTTKITCPVLKIMNDPVVQCGGNPDDLFYNGGFNSRAGFDCMLSNYIIPTMKDAEEKLDSGVYESKIVESDHNGIFIDKSQYRKIKNLVIKFFTGDRNSYKSGNFEIYRGGYDLVAELVYSVGYGTYSICGIFEGYGNYKYVIKNYNNSEFDFVFDVTDPVKDALDSLRLTCITESVTDYIRSLGESVTKKIPYNLVSSFVILRDYADVDNSYVTDEHKDLVDIADSIYNADISVSDMSKKYQDVYKKYGKAYFDKVLKDIRAIDSQTDGSNISDLVAEVNDKLSTF